MEPESACMANDNFLIERRSRRRNQKDGGGSKQAPNWHSIREDCLMSCRGKKGSFLLYENYAPTVQLRISALANDARR